MAVADKVRLPVLTERGFARTLAEHGTAALTRDAATTLQINVGKLCNQACHHCHVEAGPKRTERMTARVADRLIELMDSSSIELVDITGGAPELNGQFRRLVVAARRRGKRVIDRCNLTVLVERGYDEDLTQLFGTPQGEATVLYGLP